MFAIAQLVAAAWFGRGVIRRLGMPMSLLEQRALAATVALVVAPWIAFLAAWGLGFAIGLPLACAALLAGGHLLGRRPPAPPRVELPATSRLSWLALGIVLAVGGSITNAGTIDGSVSIGGSGGYLANAGVVLSYAVLTGPSGRVVNHASQAGVRMVRQSVPAFAYGRNRAMRYFP